VPANDRRAIRLATLLVAYDYVQAQLAVGQHVDIGHVLKLDAALAEIRMAVTPPPKVTLEIVDAPECCPKCGFTQAAKASKPAPDSHQEIKRTSEAPVENGAGQNSEQLPPAETTDSRIVEIEVCKPPLWAETGFVPRQDFHAGSPTPADHRAEPWRGHVHLGNGYGPDPSPWHVLSPPGHPLPAKDSAQ
jgi:hypothetical protein